MKLRKVPPPGCNRCPQRVRGTEAKPRYPDHILTALCLWIADGGSLMSFCKPRKLHAGHVIAWISADQSRMSEYVRARESSADLYAEQIIELADGATAENYNAVRVMVEARKWVCAKLKPQRYGDAPAINLTQVTMVSDRVRERRQTLLQGLEAMARPEPLTIEGTAGEAPDGSDEAG